MLASMCRLASTIRAAEQLQPLLVSSGDCDLAQTAKPW